MNTRPGQVLALTGETRVISGMDLIANQGCCAVAQWLGTHGAAGVCSREEDMVFGAVHQAGTLLPVTTQVLLPVRHYLACADLAGVIRGVEAVSRAVHSTVVDAVCTHGAALPGDLDVVEARGHAAHLGAGGHAVHAHARHAGGAGGEPGAAFLVLTPVVLTASASWTAGPRLSHLVHAGQLGAFDVGAEDVTAITGALATAVQSEVIPVTVQHAIQEAVLTLRTALPQHRGRGVAAGGLTHHLRTAHLTSRTGALLTVICGRDPAPSVGILLSLVKTHRWALGAALVGRGDGVLAGGRGADLGGAGDAAPHAAAALAGVGAGGEGLGGGVAHALVQAALARGAAARGGHGVRALLLARPPVTRHHLIQAGARAAAVGRGVKGRAALVHPSLVLTLPSANRTALSWGGDGVPAGGRATGHRDAGHPPIQTGATLTLVFWVQEVFPVSAVPAIEVTPLTHGAGAGVFGGVRAGNLGAPL